MTMRLVNRDKLLAPRKCVVCEVKPAYRVVDTGFNNMRNTMHEPLRGKKYVCEACGEKIGKALGMMVQASVNSMKEQIIDLENRLASAQEAIQLSEQLDKLTNYLKERTPDVAANKVAEG